jgi:hypothetical protein
LVVHVAEDEDEMPTIHVALDTSAVEAEAFDFRHSKVLNALVKAVEDGHVEVITTDINDREIRRRIETKARQAVKLIKEAYHLRSTGLFDYPDIQKKISNTAGVVADMLAAWDEFLLDAHVAVLPVEKVSIPKIVDAYFKQSPPFGPSGKQKEFPDAFAIERFRMYAEEKAVGVYLVSADGDHGKSCDGAALIHVGRIADALTKVVTEEQISTKALGFLAANSHALVVEQLNEDFEVSLSFIIESDYDADVEAVAPGDIAITQLETISVEDDRVECEGWAKVEFELWAKVGDYDSAPRDGGEYVFVPRNSVKFSSTVDVRFSVAVTLDGNEPDGIEDFSIVEPNKVRLTAENSSEALLESWSEGGGPHD